MYVAPEHEKEAFTCPHCQAVVFFDSTSCLACGTVLGYVPDGRAFTAVTTAGSALCVNRDVVTCNWLPDDGDGLCRCCGSICCPVSSSR